MIVGKTSANNRLKKFGEQVSARVVSIVNFVTIAFGFMFEDQLVTISHEAWFAWAAGIGVVGLFIAGVLFMFRANQYYNGYLDNVSRFWNWFWQIPMAGLGRAFVNLVVALLPFYQHPIIFAPIALYFGLILDLWFVKWVFARALRLARIRNSPWALPKFKFFWNR